jgi:hypothetical protein
MPANLSPEYKDAEAAYRQARDSKERLACLREMLRTIPKHKGTERLQADLKTRIKHLSDEVATAKKTGSRGGPAQVIRPEGAAQIALIGPPNSGKSSLHAALTGSGAETGPYPFTTQAPQPGMLRFEDIYFQLIDLPPIAEEHPLPWVGNALQPASACLLVVDLIAADCVERVLAIRRILAEKRVTLTPTWETMPAGDDESLEDPFAIVLPTLLIASKADRLENAGEEVGVFLELIVESFPYLAVSTETGAGLAALGPWLFRNLRVVRVYTKAPGKPPDKDIPFTVRAGDTVVDVARLVHRDFERTLKYARIWGGTHCGGRQVGREHPVADGDVLELHT